MSKTMTTSNSQKVIPIPRLLSVLSPQFDRDQTTKVEALYLKLTKKEIPQTDFFQSLKSIIGADTIKTAVSQMESPRNQSVGQKRPPEDDLVSSPTPSSKKAKKAANDERVPNLIHTLLPLLDTDQARKVKASFDRFTKGEIPRSDLIRSLCRTVGAGRVKSIYCVLKKKEIPQSRQKRAADVISALLPRLESYQAMLVRKSFVEFTKGEIPETDFIRSLCSTAGAETVQKIVRQLKARDAPVIDID